MEKNLIPAPIDEKNVTSDWIAEIFDNYGDYCIMNGNKCVGFVKDSVCTCMYIDNHIIWYFPMVFATDVKASWDELIKRLKKHDAPPLVVKYDFSQADSFFLKQSFYWEND